MAKAIYAFVTKYSVEGIYDKDLIKMNISKIDIHVILMQN